MSTARAEPELLANGDILAPVTQADGSTRWVRLGAGTDEHAAWMPHAAEPPPPRRHWRRWALIAVLLAVGTWSTGTLDEPLSHVGLNRNPCVRNAFGATFCGDDAKRYCSNLSELRKLAGTRTACDDIEEP